MKQENTLDNLIQAYGRWIIRQRWSILLVTVLVVALAASGLRFMGLVTDYRVFFSKDNPQLAAFDALQNTYTKNDGILFVLAPQGGQVFTNSALDAVEHLTREAWKVPYAIRVDSVTNFQYSRARGDELIVSDLVSHARTLSPEALAEAKRIALSEPQLLNRLISPSAHVTGVNVTLQLPGKDANEAVQAANYARRLADEIQTAHPDIVVRLTGVVMLNDAFSEAVIHDTQTLMPLMYLCMFLMILWILRSLSGAFATMMVIALSAASAMGLAGWWGIGLTPPVAQVPTILMTVGLADSIHILLSVVHEMRRGLSKSDAIVESLRANLQPVFLTTLTTVIGFLGMNFSDAPPLRQMGNITAIGVEAVFIYSALFLPAFVAILPVRVRQSASVERSHTDRLVDFVVARRRPILWSSALVVLVLGFFITRNELNDSFINYFDHRTSFRADTDFTVKNLTGIYQIEYSLGAGESGGISNPAYLAKLDEFAAWYRRQPGVMHVNTLSDMMKRLNMNMHGDAPQWRRLPDNRELAAQYLLLYELSLPYGLDLNNQISVDKSATRFTVSFKNISAREMREIEAAAEGWLRKHAPASMFTHGASSAVMFVHITLRNIQSMLTGTILEFLLIAGALVFALRSVKFGVLSLIPNIIPAVLGFGVWGMMVGRVGLGLSVVTSMTLGIVVDDTVHYLSKYLRARREKGLSAEEAIRYAFSATGTAMVAASGILIVGFLVLSLSTFELNADMGKLTAITIALALPGDLLFLPAFLMKLDGDKPRVHIEETEMNSLLPRKEELYHEQELYVAD